MTTEEIAASDMFNFYVFPLSRQQYSLRMVDLALVDCGDEALCRRVAEAIELGEQARELEFSFRGGARRNEFGPQAQRVDQELDRALGAVAKFLTTTGSAFGETSAQGQLARYALTRLFPDGVRAVIHLPYVEQEDTVRLILRRVEAEPRLGQAVRELGADRFLEHVAEVHQRYGKALRNKSATPTYAQVRAARREGQERLCQIVALVLAHLVSGEGGGDQATALWQALREVKDQNAAIGRYYKRRRRVTEVDPETGEEFEDEVESTEKFEEEDVDYAPSPFTTEETAELTERILSAIDEHEGRIADPWSPDEDETDADAA